MTESSYWTESPRRLSADWKIVLGLGAILLFVYMFGLGRYGLYDPWETHYGEVAREMVEYDNYIDPWWGSPWDPSGVKREREGFYSKPPLIMWMMAGGMELFGYNELGVRFFFPILSVMALLAIYLAVSRFYTRRTGLLATVVTATAPFFAMCSRQAVTDGPMVAIMTAGAMALVIGLFFCEDEERASPGLYAFTLGLVLLVSLGQLWAILPMDRSPDIIRPYPGTRGFFFQTQWWITEFFAVARGKGWILSALMLPFVAWAGFRVARERRRRMLYIYLFYIACGLCVPAKGWLAWAPLGGAILGYMAVTGEWRIFKTVDVPGGLLIVFISGHPWCVAMLGGHHPDWYTRFWIHDHRNRLFAGVHSIDDGGFEYFIKWIGYGLFPWIGALPGAMARAIGWLRPKDGQFNAQQKFEIFVFIWAVFSFFMFSKSSTKFHHYILPAIPAFTILMALFLDDVIENRGKGKFILLSAGAAIVFWVGVDLFRMPRAFGQGTQNFVNLFTYKYDREWARFSTDEQLSTLSGDALNKALADNQWLSDLANPLGWIAITAAIAFLLMAFSRGWMRRYGAAMLTVAGGWCLWFCYQVYLPKVAVHWSQKGMWDAYYSHCEKFSPNEEDAYRQWLLTTVSRIPSHLETFPRAWCKAPIVAFRTNWRGETFYSANTVIPAPETKHLEPFLQGWGDKPFYLFTERGRVRSELEPNLPAEWKGRHEEIFGDSLKFVLLRLDKSLPKRDVLKD